MSSDRIEKSITLKAPLSRVWRALTDAQEFGAWFRAKLEGQFTLGETVTGHITYPGYEHLVFEAAVEKMEPETKFAFRWHPYAIDPEVDYSKESTTLVEFTLEPSDSGTKVTVIESGFDQLPEHRRDLAFRMNEGGWAEQMGNIASHVGG